MGGGAFLCYYRDCAFINVYVHLKEVVCSKETYIIQREKQTAQQNTINNIKARGLRPDEAGSTSSGAVGFKKDVSQLTPKERAEFVRRASLGETITFS